MRKLVLLLFLLCPIFAHADTDCDQKAVLALSSSGRTVFAAGVTGQRVVVCSYVYSADAASDFTLQDGTGTTCGTATAAITATYKSVTGLAEDDKRYRATAGADACANLGSSVNAGVTIMWKYQR